MTTDRTQQVGRLFDEVAADYDAVGVDFFGPLASRLVQELGPRGGERWLDIGCGRGAVLVRAAEAVGPQGAAVGTDISPGMLERCAERLREAGIEHARLLEDDAQSPTLDGAYDVVSSSAVVFFLPDPAAALAAWLPLAVPGGRLGILTFAELDPRWQALDALFRPYLPQDMLDARTTGAAGPFASDAGVQDLVSAAGWSQPRTVRDEVAVRFPTPEHWLRFSLSTGQRRMWSLVPEGERDALARRAFDQLRADADADGSITYWQRYRLTLAVRP